MRVGVWRWLTFAVVFVPVVAVTATAQPPAGVPPVFPVAPEPVARKGATDTAAQRAELQAKLLELLRRIPPPSSPMPYPASPPTPKTKVDPETAGKSIDSISAGMNLFRDNDFESARRTFQLIDPTALAPEDRAFVRYMLACSMRRTNRVAEAEVIYREVANSGDDQFLADCAIWQLSLIKTEQELQLQLEQLRSRAKSK